MNYAHPLKPLAILIGIIWMLALPSKAATSDYLQNNMVANRFISLKDGTVYLVRFNTLLRMGRDEGDVWERVAEDVQSVSLDPQNSQVIYAVTTNNTVAKSLDRGQRWIGINNGLPRTQIFFVFINPANTQEIFAGTASGLYHTQDAGFSWEPTALNAPVSHLYINPMSPTHFSALTTLGVLMVSSDSGRTWQRSETGLPTEIVRRPGRTAAKIVVRATTLFFVGLGNTFLLTNTDGKGLFRSDDHGASWKQVTSGVSLSASFYAASTGEGEVVIAGTEIARSTDGVNWTPIPVKAIRFKPEYVTAIVRHPKKEGLLMLFRYAQEDATTSRIGYIGKGGALISLSFGLLPRSDVTAVWTGLFNGRRTLFATVTNMTPTRYDSHYDVETATYFSVDDGYSWEYLLIPQCGIKVAIRPGDANDMWMYGGVPAMDFMNPTYHGVAQYQPCLLRGTNAGLNWIKASGVRAAAANDNVSKIAFDPMDKSLLYYCAGVNDYRLYRYKYNPNTNEGQAVDLNVNATDVIVCEDNSKMIFIKDRRELYADDASLSNPYGTKTNRYGLLSTDGGWTWKDKSAGLAKFETNDMVPLSFRGNEIWVALLNYYNPFSHPAGLWILKSTNLGESWEVVKSFSGMECTHIYVNPEDSKDISVVLKHFTKDETSRVDFITVLETQDSGDSWNFCYSYRLTTGDENYDRQIVRSVCQFSSGNKRTMLLGGRIGLLRSDDQGKTWVRLGGVR